MNRNELAALLNKYYDGNTTPDEELLLHLALLDEPENSPFRADLMVIECSMQAAEIAKKPKFKIHFKKILWRTVASVAACFILLGGGYTYLRIADPSLKNGKPMSHEEVALQAQQAFEMLSNSFSMSQKQCRQVQQELQNVDIKYAPQWKNVDNAFQYTSFQIDN